MKTFILSLAAIVFSSNLFFAKGVEPSLTTFEGKIVTINLVDYPSDKLHVAILDIKGHELHSEEIKTENCKQRRYNLEKLPIGKYSIEINSAQRILTKKINIDRVTMELVEEVVSFKPSVHIKDNHWNVNLLAQNKKTTIQIFNDHNENLYSETIKNQMGIYKSYDLNKLEKGKYYMIIEVGEKSSTHMFEKS